MGMPTINTVIRESLLTVDNPETVEIKRVMAIVRARWTQLGGKPEEVRDHQISQERSKIRHRFGAVTKETIAAQQERILKYPAVKNRRPVHPRSNGTAKAPVLPPVTAAPLTLDNVRRTREFCSSVGGPENARELIGILEELRK